MNSTNQRIPNVGSTLARIYGAVSSRVGVRERARNQLLRHRAHLHTLFPLRYSDADPFERIYVDPDDVTAIQRPYDHPRIATDEKRRFDKYENTGRVVCGNWDRSVDSWEDLALHSGFRERFLDGVPWAETEFVRKVTSDGTEWNRRWPNSRWELCTTESEMLEMLSAYDELFEAIRTNGYQPSPVLDEVTVNVGRDGQLIHNNSGSHRLSIAKLLDVDRIPARVLVRHHDWQRRRNELRLGRTDPNDTIDHPDLSEFEW